MLRRMLSSFGKRLLPERRSSGPDAPAAEPISEARRGFFAKAAVGAVSLSGTAGMAKVVVDTMPEPDVAQRYASDAIAGEPELRAREYVLMSEQETREMVQQFVDNYHGET